MKTKFFMALMALIMTAESKAQISYTNNGDDKYMESGVVPMVGKKGLNIKTEKGEFLLKPYVLIQTSANFNYYDDEDLNLAEQDRVMNSGIAIPNALIGFTGKAFGKLTFNISLNAAKSGGALLQQAWFDVNVHDAFRIRAGKFKTPFQHAYLTTLGQTLFPTLPERFLWKLDVIFERAFFLLLFVTA